MKSTIDTNQKLPLVVIVGPTASGKTSLAINIAKKFNGEIICADSRSMYKGADIGTAKPTIEEQKIVPHWGLDLVEPGQYFSVADFKKYADQKIIEIRSRGNTPFLVGGTGLYIDAVVFNYQFGQPVDTNKRSELQRMNLDELYEYCNKNNVILPENYKNKRYVIRSIENNLNIPKKSVKPLKNSIVVGITTENSILRSRILQRIDQMFSDGVVEETKILGNIYGWDNEAMKSNAYRLVGLLLIEAMSINEVKEKLNILDWRLAKRQLTWFKRNKHINWLSLEESNKFLLGRLAIYS